MEENKKHPALDNVGDENVVNMVYHYYPEIQNRFSLLNNKYNVGCTQFDMRYNTADKPVVVAAFKPDEKGIEKFINKKIIPEELLNIFNKYGLR